ncbi:NlpC/P60 protein [Gaiella occulta]|uniref:NlpC/P60 protein n=1 Tax=Gaiella occulta TaxID=1002870 RepID=A0A7M2YWZ3_9ACTN|nr:NlpC/P60 family protein [Gaiella occulta]RDI74586.1 NlpC/P60 protein [Gaiella occulta]
MRRALLAALAVVAAALAAPALAAQPPVPAVPGPPAVPAVSSWADAQIATVTAAGLLGGDPDPAAFRPTDPLTRGELYDALTALGRQAKAPADPSLPVTMRELDAQIVAALGLLPAAGRFRVAARDAGIAPTSMLGTETVARLLGLRVDHPADQDDLELLPTQPATRAEAAYSLARVLALSDGQTAWVDQLSQTFVLPQLNDWQRSVLTRALRFVGYPYVWAGTSERRQKLWSATAPGGWVTAPGGFDCSGFVWRVYKAEPFAGAPVLAGVIRGRTTYVMSAEVAPAQRIAMDALEPGDLIFFGDKGPRSTPAQIGHMGIYVGGGWFVHSSSRGVSLDPLQGWYAKRFAWARRPLAEAGLTV